jgi:nitrite reductase/ring-hydroxylating ferredoxin subunit
MSTEVLVCRSDELKDGCVRVVAIGNLEIGIIRHKGGCYAYKNVCPHQGGPVCDGVLMPQVEDVIDNNGLFVCQKFNEDDMHIVCPWHGYEFRVTTGEHAVDLSVRLKRYEISEREGNIYVRP